MMVGPDGKRMRGDHEMEEEDRISNMPTNLIDCILERLPVDDVVRTSILSKTWRYIWASHPNLLLDNQFSSKLTAKSDDQSRVIKFVTTIYRIFLARKSPVRKFHLYVPSDVEVSQEDIDSWIKYLTADRGVRELNINVACKKQHVIVHKTPACLFDCSELCNLTLTNFTLDPPTSLGNTKGGFRNLNTLSLTNVTITALMYIPSSIKKLVLRKCVGVEHLQFDLGAHYDIQKLWFVSVRGINWSLFFGTTNHHMEILIITDSSYWDSNNIGLETFIGNIPAIKLLYLDGFSLKVSLPYLSLSRTFN